jgi:hypothetical protein
LAIGNPDARGTSFHRIFREDPTWHKIKISAFDTPNFTDEVVPDELRPLLIQRAWVERQKISWGEESARYKSKILAEFPDEADNTFFSQIAIDRGIDTEVVEDYDITPKLGVDLARFGEDDSVVFMNRDGRCRKIDTWSKATAVESANRIHRLATEHGVKEVRVDGAGLGGPVIDILVNLANDAYTVISLLGSAASPDNTRWFNARAYNFDSLREQLLEGKIDIDSDDKQLLDELLMIQYKFSPKGAIQIESKDDMRSRGVKSPDSLDALVYATVDLSPLIEGKFAGLKPGDRVSVDEMKFEREDPFLSLWSW